MKSGTEPVDEEKICAFVESSFLKPLLEDPEVTDISYNGESFFYLHNAYGRRKAKASVSQKEAVDFIRQVANLSEKFFSYSCPILDISSGKYRINAVHPSIGRIGGARAMTFSIRIASLKPRITAENGFLDEELISFFSLVLEKGVSVVIGGKTGSGKTEFQKYLLRSLPRFSRVVVIDNVLELDMVRMDRELDVNSWQYDQNNQSVGIQFLVRNALRSNPDWLVVAESRGEEMADVLVSAQTGHPIITTIHALDCESMPHRMARMVMMGEKRSDYHEVMDDISANFRLFVFLERTFEKGGMVKRRIKEIGVLDGGTMSIVYHDEDGKKERFPIPSGFLKTLGFGQNDTNDPSVFVGNAKWTPSTT